MSTQLYGVRSCKSLVSLRPALPCWDPSSTRSQTVRAADANGVLFWTHVRLIVIDKYVCRHHMYRSVSHIHKR